MTAFVALLRGVNVGGHNRIAMPDLRAVVESLGHGSVGTYIQSGNVVFSADAGSDAADEDRLGGSLRGALTGTLGLDVEVMVRSRASLTRVLSVVPFPVDDPKQVLIAFLAAAPAPEAAATLENVEAAPEEARVIGREAYLRLPNGVGRSILAPLIERRLKVAATGRNLATTRTVLAMLDDIVGSTAP